MKKLIFISTLALTVIAVSCGGPKREPGSVYMPDMAYSRAYESYPDLDPAIFTNEEAKAGSRIYYDRKPVGGTIKRGQEGTFLFANDSTGKANAKAVVNPLTSDTTKKTDLKEAERLFNIYCAICHGTDAKGEGPLVKSGKWAGNAANLMDLSKFGTGVYGDGQIFHSITYGKNTMGGYGSQLNNKQRWMLVSYIRSKQNASAAPAAVTAIAAPTTGKPTVSATATTPTATTKPSGTK